MAWLSRKLWVRLWGAYTLVAFLGVLALLTATNIFFVQAQYSRAYTPENLQDFLSAEIESNEGLGRIDPQSDGVEDALQRLINVRLSDQQLGRSALGLVSYPEAIIELRNAQGDTLAQAASEGWSELKASDLPLQAQAYMPEEGLTVRVKLYAPFSYSKALLFVLDLLVEQAIITFVISTVVGLLCGVVAARYITRRLVNMDDATKEWSQGNFAPKITLVNSDELGIHAERLNAMSQELESHFAVKQALAVSNERTRLARDLHDTVKQNLFALGLQLASLRDRLEKEGCLDDEPNENLCEAEQINRDAQRDLIDIIAQLRTSEELDESLGDALHTSVIRLRRKFDIEINLDAQSDLTVSPQIESDLERAIGELVTNAVRHGRANRVRIKLEIGSALANISVVDDGCGFDPNKATSGLGLKSVAGRIANLPEGKFTITSQAGDGATARIQWSYSHG